MIHLKNCKLLTIYQSIKQKLENNHTQKIMLCIEVLLCTLVFTTLSGGKGVDWDEAFTHQLVTYNDLLGIIKGTAEDVHPPLYYLIVKLCTIVFGNKLYVYTWVSIIGGLGCMILNSTLICKRFGFWTSVLLNPALAFAPTIFYYNINIRMYSWTLFFCLGCLLFACEIMEKGSAMQWIMLFLFSICGVYTQYFAVFPIVATYMCLMLFLIVYKQWKKFIPFGIVCILNILSFIPWIYYASNHFITTTAPETYFDNFQYLPKEFFNFASSTDLINVDNMQLILFFISFLIFLFIRKEFTVVEQWFLFMLFFCCVFCFYGTQILAIYGNHFYTWRYIYPVVGIIWIIYCIIFTKLGIKVYLPFTVFSLVLCISSYERMYDWEYNTTPLLEKTVAFTDANIEDGCTIVSDYGNAERIYRYYLPNHNFVLFENLNLDAFEKGETFWFIQLGGSYFTEGMKEAYGLEIEHYSGFGYMGMIEFELEKVTVTK